MSIAQTIIAQSAPATPPPAVDPAAPPAEGAPAAAPVEDAVSPKLAMIAKKERDLVRKQQEFQKSQADWQKERETMKAELEAERAKRAMWKEDPDKLLEEMGWDYDRLTERKLNGGGLTPKDLEKKMEERFKSFDERMAEERAALEKAQAEKKDAEAKKIVDDFKGELKSFVTSKADKYKLSNLFDPEAELLYDTIDAYYQEHEKVLSNDEAADLVEKYFKKLYDDAHQALTPAEEKALAEEKKALGVPEKKPTTTTLTNDMATSTSGFVSAKTDNDRMKRAMAALEGKK